MLGLARDTSSYAIVTLQFNGSFLIKLQISFAYAHISLMLKIKPINSSTVIVIGRLANTLTRRRRRRKVVTGHAAGHIVYVEV